jgi:hypothetical protein
MRKIIREKRLVLVLLAAILVSMGAGVVMAVQAYENHGATTFGLRHLRVVLRERDDRRHA